MRNVVMTQYDLARLLRGERIQYCDVEVEASPELREAKAKPLPQIIFCPNGHRHVDKGEFATKPHHTHACQECGMVWRPAIENTVGVQFLPGFKDKE